MNILVYISIARDGLPDAEVQAILASARRRNAEQQITGALLKYADRFIQVLEGPREALDGCVSRIRRDLRHRNLKVLRHHPVAERRFGGWKMRDVRVEPGAEPTVDQFVASLAEQRDPRDVDRAITTLHALAQRH
jgi:hypothetical protein